MGPAWAAPSAQSLEVGLARVSEVGLVDGTEGDELDRVDLDVSVGDAVAATGFDLRSAPQTERHGDLAGKDSSAQLGTELHQRGAMTISDLSS
jgi:hypothetical protein